MLGDAHTHIDTHTEKDICICRFTQQITTMVLTGQIQARSLSFFHRGVGAHPVGPAFTTFPGIGTLAGITGVEVRYPDCYWYQHRMPALQLVDLAAMLLSQAFYILTYCIYLCITIPSLYTFAATFPTNVL